MEVRGAAAELDTNKWNKGRKQRIRGEAEGGLQGGQDLLASSLPHIKDNILSASIPADL